MKKYIMIILAAISTLSLSFTAEAYTREELEEQVRSGMSADYEVYKMNQAQLEATQKTLDGLADQEEAALKELEEKVRNDEITDAEYKKQKKAVENNYKDLRKSYEKQVKNYQNMMEDFDDELNDRLKEVDKKMEEQEKNADKAEEKTAKLNAALAECEGMVASSAKRQECSDKALKKYGLSDEEKEALAYRDSEKAAQAAAAEKAAAEAAAQAAEAAAAEEEAALQQLLQDSMEEEMPEEEEIVQLADGSYGTASGGAGASNTGAADGTTEIAGVAVVTEGSNDTLSGGNASNPSTYGGGANGLSGCTSGDIFDQITCKVLGFLSDLRVLAYVISGFGMIVFTYGAIFNKINWKHFSYIAVGLFLLSVMGSFIQYFSGDKTAATKLGYGNHMSGSYSQISGTSGGGSAVSSSDIPNVNVGNTSTANVVTGGGTDSATSGSGTSSSSGSGTDSGKDSGSKGFSLKDFASSLSSGINAVRDVYNAAVSTEGGIKNIGGIISNVSNAIKNNKTDLDGLINTATSIAGTINRGTFEAKNDVNNLVDRAESLANNLQDVFSSSETKAENQARREEGEATNKVAEWLQNIGSKAKDTAADTSQAASNAAGSVGEVGNVANEGQMIGGDALGAMMGAAQAIIETAQPPQY